MQLCFDLLITAFLMRLKVENNVFLIFDLMKIFVNTTSTMISKVANNAFLTFDLMKDLLATSTIMRSNLLSCTYG